MKTLNFTATEILSKLLSKEKTQTIRKAWKICEWCYGKGVIGGDLDEYNCKCGDAKGVISKPPTYKVGDKVQLMWEKDMPERSFCTGCGNPMTKLDGYCKWGGCNKKMFTSIFNKILGTGTITEVFEIEMRKDNKRPIGLYYIKEFPIPTHRIVMGCIQYPKFINDFAERDGFPNSEAMFKWFDEKYDLSEPKKFYVYRWGWD